MSACYSDILHYFDKLSQLVMIYNYFSILDYSDQGEKDCLSRTVSFK